MKGESAVNQSINDELHSLYIQRDQREGECDDTGSIMDEPLSPDFQGDQKESECGVTQSIMDELFFGYRTRSNGR